MLNSRRLDIASFVVGALSASLVYVSTRYLFPRSYNLKLVNNREDDDDESDDKSNTDRTHPSGKWPWDKIRNTMRNSVINASVSFLIILDTPILLAISDTCTLNLPFA